MFLTCCPLDRAYCGKTGNKADMHLCCGKFKLESRLGLADGIHIFNSAGVKCWEARTSAGADGEDSDDGQDSKSDKDSDNSSRSSSDSDTSMQAKDARYISVPTRSLRKASRW